MAIERGGADRGQVSVQAASSTDEGELIVRLSRLARSLQDHDEVDATLQAITHAAVTALEDQWQWIRRSASAPLTFVDVPYVDRSCRPDS